MPGCRTVSRWSLLLGAAAGLIACGRSEEAVASGDQHLESAPACPTPPARTPVRIASSAEEEELKTAVAKRIGLGATSKDIACDPIIATPTGGQNQGIGGLCRHAEGTFKLYCVNEMLGTVGETTDGLGLVVPGSETTESALLRLIDSQCTGG